MNVIKTKSFEEYRSKVVESNLPTLLTASKHIHFYFKFLFYLLWTWYLER